MSTYFESIKIMTFNAGIWTRNRKKTDKFYWKDRMKAMHKMLLEQSPDVICFQELWFPMNLYIPKEYHKVFGTGLEHPLYVKKGLKVKRRKFRIFWSMATVEGLPIYSVHGNWDPKLYNKILLSLQKERYNVGASVFAGDFNMEYSDIHNSPFYFGRSVRVSLNEPKRDTYIHFRNPDRRGELDHVFYWGCVPYLYYIIPDKDIRISDHLPIMVVIRH